MAGGDSKWLLRDPAIERWASMRETTTKHFKWTPKTTSRGLFWGLFVPFAMYTLTVKIMEDNDEKEGRPKRRFL